MERTTLELLDAWHTGDKDALVALIERHVPWLRNRVRHGMTAKMRLFETSEDVVQTILYNLLRYTPPFRPENELQFRALIARAVHNRLCELHDYVTAQARDPERVEPLPSAPSRIGVAASPSSLPDRKLTNKEELEQAQQERGFVALALQLIDPEERRIVHLHDFQQKTFAQIGAGLKVSEEGARSRYRRALARLRDQVERLRRGQLDDLVKDVASDPGGDASMASAGSDR